MIMYEDALAQDTIEDITNRRFVELPDAKLNFGFTRSAIWLKLEVPPSKTESFYLLSCYIQVDELDVYIPTADGWRVIQTGDTRSFATRDVKHPCYVFDLSMATETTIYVRSRTTTLNRIPLKLINNDDFWQQQSWTQFGYGFYFAVLASMFIYNFFVFLVTRDMAYIYYVGYLGGIALFLGSMSGHSKMFLWPNATVWSNLAPMVLVSLSIASVSLYIILITHTTRYSPIMAKLMLLSIPFSLVVIISSFFGGALPIMLLGGLALYVLVIATIAIIKSARQGYRPGKVMLLGIIIMFPSSVVYYLNTIDVLTDSWLANNVFYITSSLEAMILSIALAYRIEALKEELEIQQHKSVEMRQSFSHQLLQSADNERRAIARELHDSFGQALLVVKNMVNHADSSQGKQQITQQLRNLINDTRNMARNMHPQQIENLGFATALETMMTETILPAGIALTCELEDVTGLLTKDTELQLYRIAQECATNIVRHSHAGSAQAHLIKSDSGIVMKICDDGVGISPQAEMGMGLFNIRERATIIGADLEIQPRKPRGTNMIIQVPIK